MPIRKLDSIFRPKRIALLGVSNDPNSVGGITLKNLIGGGFNGVVYPINPKREAVMGVPCYPDVKSLPKTPDLAIIMTAAKLLDSKLNQRRKTFITKVEKQISSLDSIFSPPTESE